MNFWLDCIQIWYGCSLCISDDLINFWDESIKNKMAAAPIYKKKPPKKLVGSITYEPLVGLHSNLVWLFSRYFWWSFGMNQIKTKCLPQPFKKMIDMVVVGVIFFSLFLDIDEQSLRLRGPAINWWLFLSMLPAIIICFYSSTNDPQAGDVHLGATVIWSTFSNVPMGQLVFLLFFIWGHISAYLWDLCCSKM